ncbi:MAG: hypothetical protein HWE13_13705 [Gammaproteobacteria bacterium]|nr:hypothetical protein [Gammaproteobacteria bacterium]
MSRQCRGCQREIAWGSQDCPFCGTTNNQATQWFKRLGQLLGFCAVVIVAGYGLAEWRVASETAEISAQLNQQIATLNARNQQLEQQVNTQQQEMQQLKQRQDELKAAGSDTSAALTDEITTLKVSLAASEQERERQEGRASWLGKENTRLKDEVTTLQQQVATLNTQLEALRKTAAQPVTQPADASSTPVDATDGN